MYDGTVLSPKLGREAGCTYAYHSTSSGSPERFRLTQCQRYRILSKLNCCFEPLCSSSMREARTTRENAFHEQPIIIRADNFDALPQRGGNIGHAH